MNNSHKNKLLLIVLAAILILGGIFLFRGGDSEEVEEISDSPTVREGEVVVEGEITCLPYTRLVADSECVKAIEGEDGKIYALDSTEVRGAENALKEGTEVTAIGVFVPANTSVDESSVFSYDGVLTLRTLKRR